jgi:hypothetical protein
MNGTADAAGRAGELESGVGNNRDRVDARRFLELPHQALEQSQAADWPQRIGLPRRTDDHRRLQSVHRVDPPDPRPRL